MNTTPAPTVVVLTALEVEYAAVRALLGNRRITSHPSGTRFEVGEPPHGRGTIVLALTGQGNQAAAVLTERAIATFAPSALVFVGIAGALHDDIGLGDIIVATKVYAYHGGRDEDGGFHARPQAWEIPHQLDQIARHVAREGEWTTLLRSAPQDWPPVHFRPIAAGEVVLNSTTTPLARQLRTNYDDAAAVERESAGVAKAGHLNRGLPVVTIRGISDEADGDKRVTGEAGWQPVAAARAAAFALALAVEIPAAQPGTVTTGMSWPYRVGVVPARADNFQDRDLARVLVDVTGELPGSTSGGPARTTVLSGLGGVGKTQLAADYAERAWAGREIDLLVWITAETRESILTAYAQLARSLTGIDDADAESGARRLLSWLAATPKRWLLVLDDLQQPADLHGLWPPESGTGKVVVTTRRRDASLVSDRRRIVGVDEFTPAESRAYLGRKLAGQAHLADEVAELAGELGHLPLALAQAAVYLLDRQIPCSEYRRRFARRKLAAVLPDRHSLPGDHQATVAATWALSIAHADQLEPAGLAGPLLRFLSVLDPHGIPRDLITAPAVMDFLGKTARRRVTPDSAHDALACLHRLNLVTLSSQTPHQAVRVHALVQRATRDDLRPKSFARITKVAADSLMRVWEANESDPALDAALRSNTFHLQASGDPQQLWRLRSRELFFQAGRSLAEHGLAAAAVVYFQRLSLATGERFGAHHLHTMMARYELALAQGASGDPKGAVAALSALVTDLHRSRTRKNRMTLTARSALARYKGESGDVAGAVAEYESLLPDMERVFGPDHPSTSATRHNSAVMRSGTGDVAGAVAALERVVMERQDRLGPDHPDTLSSRSALAAARGDSGDFAGAVAAYESLAPDLRRAFGPDHPVTLAARSGLADVLGESGDLAGAIAGFESLVQDRHRVFGPDAPETLETRSKLAWLRGAEGDAAGAVAAYESLVRDQQRVLGPDNPSAFVTRHNLAAMRGAAGDAAGAVAVIEELLPDLHRVFGPASPNVLTTRHNLARFRGMAGDPAGAVADLENLLPDLVRVFGPDHPHTLPASHTLAGLRGETGDLPGAVAALERLLPELRRVFGPDHPETSGCLEELTRFRSGGGDAAGR